MIRMLTVYVQQCTTCTETCHIVVEEGSEIGVFKPGTAPKSALKTVFVFIYQVISGKFQ
jgi:hypothetical protein